MDPGPRALIRRGRASEYRMLVIGPDEFTGVGSVEEQLPFSGLLARNIGRALGGGIDFESIVADGAMPQQILRAVHASSPSQADAVVLVVDTASPAGQHAVGGLVEDTRARMRSDAVLVVAGLASDIAPDLEVDLDGRPNTILVRLGDPSVDESCDARTERWTTRIAEPLLACRRPSGWWLDPSTIDESSRARQARRAERLGAAVASDLRGIVDLACAAYGTSAGAVCAIAGGDSTILAARNIGATWLPREQTLCDTALWETDGLVVPDAWADPRFRPLSLVHSGEVGFYVGHPLRTPGGFRIGVLAVWDPAPRDGEDARLLRSFARDAERILGRALQAVVPAPAPLAA